MEAMPCKSVRILPQRTRSNAEEDLIQGKAAVPVKMLNLKRKERKRRKEELKQAENSRSF